ncbi:MAG TPA: hypothetical protein VFU15_04835, partial [Bacteroidia bacterium]|nr:hypothetical protein [Bacteroidia bacterium]
FDRSLRARTEPALLYNMDTLPPDRQVQQQKNQRSNLLIFMKQRRHLRKPGTVFKFSFPATH